MAASWWQDISRSQLSALEEWETVLNKIETELLKNNTAGRTEQWGLLLNQAAKASGRIKKSAKLANSRITDARRSGIPESEIKSQTTDKDLQLRIQAASEKSRQLSKQVRAKMGSVSNELKNLSASGHRRSRQTYRYTKEPSLLDIQA